MVVISGDRHVDPPATLMGDLSFEIARCSRTRCRSSVNNYDGTIPIAFNIETWTGRRTSLAPRTEGGLCFDWLVDVNTMTKDKLRRLRQFCEGALDEPSAVARQKRYGVPVRSPHPRRPTHATYPSQTPFSTCRLALTQRLQSPRRVIAYLHHLHSSNSLISSYRSHSVCLERSRPLV